MGPPRLGEAVREAVRRDPLGAELRCSLFAAALQSYRRDSVLRPFPSRYGGADAASKDFEALVSGTQPQRCRPSRSGAGRGLSRGRGGPHLWGGGRHSSRCAPRAAVGTPRGAPELLHLCHENNVGRVGSPRHPTRCVRPTAALHADRFPSACPCVCSPNAADKHRQFSACSPLGRNTRLFPLEVSVWSR